MLDNDEQPVENTSENLKKEIAISDNDKLELQMPTSKINAAKAIEEVEKSVAENAEVDNSNDIEVLSTDYNALSLEELVLHLKEAIDKNPIDKIKSVVESVKSTFNIKFGALLAKKKKEFLDAGGNSIDFQFSSPVKLEYNGLLSKYKKQRDEYYSILEKELSSNLEKRLLVIEKLKELIINANTATMYKEFKELQDFWRAIGPVSKTRYNDTWKTYHHHVERFYDLLHLSNDFRDLDFKNNLEEKLKIIKRAEELAMHTDANYAFKELQSLHKTWKEDLGPVAKEMREEVWQKFSNVTKKIHDKRHQYYKEMRSKYQEIIDAKLSVVAKINEYRTDDNKTHNHWQKSIKEIEQLRQAYFDAGKLPYNKSEEVWQQFKKATKKFNSAKNLFYKKEKEKQQVNLEEKLKLIKIAESLKDSEDWENAVNTLKKIQADWKKIGHVPRKFSDDIWRRFKEACNYFFDRYHNQKKSLSQEEQKISDNKKEFLETLELSKVTQTKDSILEAIVVWRNLGRLPRNARHLDAKFNKLIDNLLDNLSLNKKDIEMLKFTNVVDGYVANNDIKKLDSEKLYIRKKMDEIVREMQQLENNLGFFSNAKDDNPLVLNVKKKVDNFKNELIIWKNKLNYIKKLEF